MRKTAPRDQHQPRWLAPPIYRIDPSRIFAKVEVDESQGVEIGDGPNLMSTMTYKGGGLVTFTDGSTVWLQRLELFVDEGAHKREIHQP